MRMPAGLPPVTQFVHKNPVIYTVFERGVSGRFAGCRSGNTEKESAFLHGEFSPIPDVENVGRVVVIAKGYDVVDNDGWRRDRTAKPISFESGYEAVAKSGNSGQSGRMPGVALSSSKCSLAEEAGEQRGNEVMGVARSHKLQLSAWHRSLQDAVV
jgi:hypothetical protein